MGSEAHISILGCGWLGLPLAKTAILAGWKVKGTVTKAEKLAVLHKAGVDPFLIHFNGGQIPGLPDDFLRSKVLVICIPPGRSDDKRRNYQAMANAVTSVVRQAAAVQKIILVSSTSVYGDVQAAVSEYDDPHPETESAKLLLDVENQFREIKAPGVAIVRFGGLIGPGRHPARFFKGKTAIPDGLAPVNMIHLDDAIGLLMALAHAENSNGFYNGCSPSHPTKQDFYALAAITAGMEPPHFIPEKKLWKQVDSLRVEKELGYTFKYPDLMQWVQSKNDL